MIEINGVKYNTSFIAYVRKEDKDDKYYIIYTLTNGTEFSTEFDNQADRDTAFNEIEF